jgi:ABC-type siderophore export system fused ATPase/permease subunit
MSTGYRERVAALDAYLDNVEELLDEWGQRRGIERETL